MDPDNLIAGWIKAFSPLWGPFYAIFYIVRLLWREIFINRK